MTKITNAPAPRPLATQTPRAATPSTQHATVSKGWSASAVSPSTDTAASAAKVATAFYEAFSKRDAAGMAQAYDPGVTFHDPLFGTLNGQSQVMDMWKTILPAANPATFRIEPKVVGTPTARPDGSYEVKVHWDAHYDLGQQHVDNSSDTTLLVKHGKIIGQRDEWNLDDWTRQALPFGGGNHLTDALAHFAAHSFIEVKSLLAKL